jgi:hypothetical protein
LGCQRASGSAEREARQGRREDDASASASGSGSGVVAVVLLCLGSWQAETLTGNAAFGNVGDFGMGRFERINARYVHASNVK